MMLPISELGVTETGEFEFDAASNQLEIKFLSLGFRPGEVLRYQFMLEDAFSKADRGPERSCRRRIANVAGSCASCDYNLSRDQTAEAGGL